MNSETYDRLPPWQQAQVDAVADILRRVGAYSGSDSDARTDASAIVLAMRFSPQGDNHHNARLCPYCNP